MRAFQPTIGLALGGGAARGMAHLGVLRALEREQIPIHIIVGTSMGAILGGAYAAGTSVADLEAQVRAVLGSEAFRRTKLSFLKETKRQRAKLFFSVANLVRRGIFIGVSSLRQSFLSAEAFADSMAAIIPDRRIEDLGMRFAAVALDLEAAEEVVLTRGSLRVAAAASSAIPGILPPVRLDGRALIDGGWVDKVPVLPAFKLGADVVLAVDITANLRSLDQHRRSVDIMVRANAIKDEVLVGFSRRLADVLIEPECGDVHWADFGSWAACIERGDEAATAAIPRIREILRQERLMSMVRDRRKKRMAEAHLKSRELKLTIV